MTTDRRGFLKALGLGVAGLSLGWPLADARAQAAWNGRFLLYVHAGGGWDPTSFCDPKGRETADSPDPVNHYPTGDIRSPDGPSPLRWAPFADNDAFFGRYGDRLLVLNGLDTSTNGHESGTRYAGCGTLADTHPALTALYAGVWAHDLSMPFLTNGAFDGTRGVVSRTRVSNLNGLERLADPNDVGNSQRLLSDSARERIARFHAERATARIDAGALPREAQARSRLLAARATDAGIGRLRAQLPDLNGFRTSLGKQGAVALAAWKAGLTASANVSVGGFDTHGNHDTNQATALTGLTQGLDEILREIERRDAASEVVVLVGSDFGRTPSYNEGNGKDHWPVTSMLVLGAGVRGNRVLGGSSATYRSLPVDPQTLAPLAEGAPGLVFTPAHVHRALRTHLGLTGSELDRLYPIDVEDLPLFG